MGVTESSDILTQLVKLHLCHKS